MVAMIENAPSNDPVPQRVEGIMLQSGVRTYASEKPGRELHVTSAGQIWQGVRFASLVVTATEGDQPAPVSSDEAFYLAACEGVATPVTLQVNANVVLIIALGERLPESHYVAP